MTGYKFEMWSDLTEGPNPKYVVRITDPQGETIGEVISPSEETSIKLACELKTRDSRFKCNYW